MDVLGVLSSCVALIVKGRSPDLLRGETGRLTPVLPNKSISRDCSSASEAKQAAIKLTMVAQGLIRHWAFVAIQSFIFQLEGLHHSSSPPRMIIRASLGIGRSFPTKRGQCNDGFPNSVNEKASRCDHRDIALPPSWLFTATFIPFARSVSAHDAFTTFSIPH